MDSSTKDKNTSSTPASTGEIFTSNSPSTYEQTVNAVNDMQDEQNLSKNISAEEQVYAASQDASPSSVMNSQDNMPPPDHVPYASPFYAEDKKKKIFLLGFIVLLICGMIFGGISLIRRFSTKPSSPKDVKITYWGLWEEPEVMQVVLDDYKRIHPNITITYTRQDPKQYRERLQAAISRGEGPDIFRYHNTWLPMMIQYMSALPKSIYTVEEFSKTFYPVITQDVQSSGSLYGVPLMIDGLLLFYNEDILKSANVSVPKTWLDVQKTVPRLTVKEKNKIITSAFALGTAENIEHFSDILSLMMLQNGTNPYRSLFSCVDTAVTTCAVETLTFYRKFTESSESTWDDTLENSILAFSGGKVGMILAPSWQAFSIKQLNPNLHFKTAQVPQLPCEKEPCSSVHLATYWVEGVSSNSKYSVESWQFLKYLSQPEVLQKLFSEQVKYRNLFGEAYPRIDMANLLKDNEYLAPLITEAPYMRSFYAVTRTNDGETGLNTVLTTYFKDAINSLSQGTSFETALHTADNGFQQAYARFGLTPAQ